MFHANCDQSYFWGDENTNIIRQKSLVAGIMVSDEVQSIESVEESLNVFMSERFPPNAKQSTSYSSLSRSSPIMCLLEREVSIFLLSRLQKEKIVYLHVDADLIFHLYLLSS